MPLAFDSVSHGAVAFGFFNISTHALLLDELFFFADRFCEAVVALVDRAEVTLEGWRVERGVIGDLQGAIAGIDLSGLIGATYRLYPFPPRPEDFKQDPEGHRTEEEVRGLLARFGRQEPLPLARSGEAVCIAEYRFTPANFAALLRYVERGGYPRWRGEVRPAYVERMSRALRGGATPDSSV